MEALIELKKLEEADDFLKKVQVLFVLKDKNSYEYQKFHELKDRISREEGE